MPEETEELVQENIRLTRENNRLLKKLWRAEVFGFWSRVIFIAVLIGVPVLIYQYYLSDVVRDLREMYDQTFESIKGISDLPSQVSLGAVIESLEEARKDLIE